MQMYSLGVPFHQIVDDYLPIWDNNYDQPIFANIGYDDSLWGAITEKEFAKWYGNYEHTIAGWMKHAVSALNGSPVDEKWHHSQTADQIWDFLRTHHEDKDIITAASNFDCGSDNNLTPDGIACSHAYSILGSKVMEFEDSETGVTKNIRMIKVRNPWGTENYWGPWSDFHANWNLYQLPDDDTWYSEWRS